MECKMKVTFLGGADEVGASSTLVEIGGKVLLVDAGIRISPKSNNGIDGDQLPDLHPISEAGGPDYLLVTHAHTDHTGALPLVMSQYPHIPVYATKPTIDLTRVLQADAQRIMRSKNEQEGELPIFDDIASDRLMQAFQEVQIRQPIKLGDNLQVTYYTSGHIVGAATLVIESEEGVLVMSGDVSQMKQRAVVEWDIPRRKADALILESTYGGRLHANREVEEKRMIDTLRRITAEGGKVLIPAFALGRAQEILQIILAHRQHLDVPVYADGMVRAVCRAYNNFTEWLPPATVKAAGDDPLFFRDGVRAVDNALQRNEILHSAAPAIIVASSGMLTGGASAAYAKELAGDPLNAILLTGYQDEESPGRLLQRILREREEGKTEEVTIKIDNKPVTLRCYVGSYSLSAHSDNEELIAYNNQLDPSETFLVHGDPNARYKLAMNIRERGRVVHQPKTGQSFTLVYKRRPMNIAHSQSGHEVRPVVAAELWQALKDQTNSFYSARELARMWWGNDERTLELSTALIADGLHFAADWRRKDHFRVRTAEQVERARAQRQIMTRYPDLTGKLIVLKDSNNRPHLAVVIDSTQDTFEAIAEGARGRVFPADAFLWVISKWDGPADAKEIKPALTLIAQAAKSLSDMVLSYEYRQTLINTPVNPEALLPEVLPADVTREAALAAIVLGLAGDGASYKDGALVPVRALRSGPLDQSSAHQTALSLFPPEARLRKVGLEVARKRMTLYFDFPEPAAKTYSDLIDQLDDMTGWDVLVNPSINQQALMSAISEVLPENLRITKGPSYFIDKREVSIEVEANDGTTPDVSFAQAYLRMTGYRLRVAVRGAASTPPMPMAQDTPLEQTPAEGETAQRREPMEINAAYGVLRLALEPDGLYKCSLKGHSIMLTFISPQVGARHMAKIQTLAKQIGYPLTINPNPNQQQILQIAQQLMNKAGWQVRKGPGIHTDRGQIAITLVQAVTPMDVSAVDAALEQATGYRLVVA
jgi:uncharacterized protein